MTVRMGDGAGTCSARLQLSRRRPAQALRVLRARCLPTSNARPSKAEVCAPALHRALSIAASTAAAALLATAPADAAACGKHVIKQNFNQYQGKYVPWEKDDMLRDFAVDTGRRAGADGKERPAGPQPGSARVFNAQVGYGNLKMNYPQKCVGARDNCGMVMYVRLPQPLTEATYSYKVRFSDDYDWTAGGKLPGICSEKCPVGLREGGEDFSARTMWRKGGRLVSYMYLPGKEKGAGADWRWVGDQASDEGYKHVRVYVRMNDTNRADGILRAWLDDRLVYEDTGVRFRVNNNVLIEKLALHNYHGGRVGDPRFEPSKRQYQLLDDIEVREGECGPKDVQRVSARSAPAMTARSQGRANLSIDAGPSQPTPQPPDAASLPVDPNDPQAWLLGMGGAEGKGGKK